MKENRILLLVHLRSSRIWVKSEKYETSASRQYWSIWECSSRNWSEYVFQVCFLNGKYSDIISMPDINKTMKWFIGWLLFEILKMLQIMCGHYKTCNLYKVYFILNNLMIFFYFFSLIPRIFLRPDQYCFYFFL